MIIDLLSNVDFRLFMWVIPLMLFLHEMEEWNILDWYHSTFISPPKSTKLSCRIWLFIMSIGGVTVTAIAYVIPQKYISTGIVIFLAVFTIFNGIQHIYWTIAFRKYAPGVIFSSIGILCGVTVISAALLQKMTSPFYVAVLFIITIPFVIKTYRAKNTLTKPIENLHNLSLKIVKILER